MVETLEFYRKLSKKMCAVCGHEMEEQAECYLNVCKDCEKEIEEI